MQLAEVDDVHGVRAAVITFASDASSLRFVLVPVSPLGEPAHYEALRETLRSCDLVVTTPPGAGRAGWPGCATPSGSRSGSDSAAAGT
jgi:hypothetical protein